MSSREKPTIIIPSRLSSSRLPGKALLKETGKFLIQHVYERALGVRGVSRVLVATDSREIIEAVEGFGGKAVMTSPDHCCGTDRVAEAARSVDSEILINVQGDEPLFPTGTVEEGVAALVADPHAAMVTFAYPVEDPARYNNPNAVKVVMDQNGYALYFSRAPIPSGAEAYYHHMGLYIFRRETLFLFAQLSPGPLERREKLEQLRVIEHGLKVKIVLSSAQSLDVNTTEDYVSFVRLWRDQHPSTQ